jgi:endonuclease G, mitochondrial
MKKLGLLLLTLMIINSCTKKENEFGSPAVNNSAAAVRAQQNRSVYTGFPEAFETGSKTAYAAADVVLSTGSWNLNDALLGTSASDRKNGAKCVRIENSGIITMNFDVTNGVTQVTIAHGVYGTDASSTWGLWYSGNGGSTWTQTGSNITTSLTTLSNATFTVNVSGSYRFQLRKLSGGRLNIDDISISDNSSSGATRDDNMGMGNPSGATTNT